MSTVYTVNGKVLKNAANDKWLAKKESPAGFVMDASNAEYFLMGSDVYVAWQSPSYPNDYNGDGKQYILVNNNSTAPGNAVIYSNANHATGPKAIYNGISTLGTSTGVLLNNAAFGYGFGSYLVWANPLQGATLEQVQAYMANVSITILDQ